MIAGYWLIETPTGIGPVEAGGLTDPLTRTAVAFRVSFVTVIPCVSTTRFINGHACWSTVNPIGFDDPTSITFGASLIPVEDTATSVISWPVPPKVSSPVIERKQTTKIGWKT